MFWIILGVVCYGCDFLQPRIIAFSCFFLGSRSPAFVQCICLWRRGPDSGAICRIPFDRGRQRIVSIIDTSSLREHRVRQGELLDLRRNLVSSRHEGSVVSIRLHIGVRRSDIVWSQGHILPLPPSAHNGNHLKLHVEVWVQIYITFYPITPQPSRDMLRIPTWTTRFFFPIAYYVSSRRSLCQAYHSLRWSWKVEPSDDDQARTEPERHP